MEGSKAPRSVLASKGLQILAAPAMRKRSIRLPSFKRTASKPVMEQVVEDVEATPKKDVKAVHAASAGQARPDGHVAGGGRDVRGHAWTRPPRPWGRQPGTTRSRRRGGGRCRRSRRGPWIWTQSWRAPRSRRRYVCRGRPCYAGARPTVTALVDTNHTNTTTRSRRYPAAGAVGLAHDALDDALAPRSPGSTRLVYPDLST